MRPQFFSTLAVVSACAFTFMTFKSGIPLWQQAVSGLGLIGCIVYGALLLARGPRLDADDAHPGAG